jgi:origin recognition complex subunit 5
MRDKREALYQDWPGRKEQIDQLVQLLGDANAPPIHEAVLVYGGAALGKTSVVRAVLESEKRPYAYASCLTCTTQSLLFEVRRFTERIAEAGENSYKRKNI